MNLITNHFTPCLSGVTWVASEVFSRWREIVMIAGVALSVAGVAAAFFASAPLFTSTFALLGAVTAIGFFSIQDYALLKTLGQSLDKLKEENMNLHSSVHELSRENSQLQASNRVFSANNAQLTQTNQELTAQVAMISLQAAQLSETARHSKEVLEAFKREHGVLTTHTGRLDTSISTLGGYIESSEALRVQIAACFSHHDATLTSQLADLRAQIAELSRSNRLADDMRALSALKEELRTSSAELSRVQTLYGEELEKMRAVTRSLTQVPGQLNQTDQRLQQAVRLLTTECERMRQILSLRA